MATTERLTVTLSSDLVEGERQGLLVSIANPHPESFELAEAGFADWADALPEAEGLIDVTAGKAVRWIEGEGWIADSE
jgi:hypothetical protein